MPSSLSYKGFVLVEVPLAKEWSNEVMRIISLIHFGSRPHIFGFSTRFRTFRGKYSKCSSSPRPAVTSNTLAVVSKVVTIVLRVTTIIKVNWVQNAHHKLWWYRNSGEGSLPKIRIMNTNPESRPPLGETCSLHQKLKQPFEWTSRQRHSTLQKLDNWNILMLKQRNCELARKKIKHAIILCLGSPWL